MAISDVVVSCSTDPEAFGRVTLEALAIGKPVAAYDHGGVAEQLDELLPDGKIAVGNTQGMAKLLMEWLEKPKLPNQSIDFTLQSMLSSIQTIYGKQFHR
jgi:glycosyltransferase involved in cell wall biosynthesis